MRVRIKIHTDDEEEPAEEVDLPVPEPPSEEYPGGGHWRWVGSLPRARVDITENYSLAIYLIKTNSTHARVLEHEAQVPVFRRGVNRVPPKPEDGDDTAICPKCMEEFPTSDAMLAHWNELHEGQPRTDPATEKWACRHCGAELGNPGALANHMKLHRAVKRQALREPANVETRYSCKSCSRSFPSQRGLSRHWTTMHGVTARATAATTETPR
ncbi:MAG: C2H2-type zinc finger protein [Thermoplasmata archaeon]